MLGGSLTSGQEEAAGSGSRPAASAHPRTFAFASLRGRNSASGAGGPTAAAPLLRSRPNSGSVGRGTLVTIRLRGRPGKEAGGRPAEAGRSPPLGQRLPPSHVRGLRLGMGSSGSRPQSTSNPEGLRSRTEKLYLTKPEPKQTGCFPRRRILRKKKFRVQVQIAGKTGGCERKFLKWIKKQLSHQRVSLRVKESTETSKDPVLVFCPIASRIGTDIENALEGLSRDRTVLLVVMHYVPKDGTGPIVDMWQRQTHPAMVQVVHTRYTLQDGFYPCEMNASAVADMAAAIKNLTKHH